MDFSNISDYSSYLTSTSTAKAQTNKLQNSLNRTSESSTDDELLDACKQFESYLWEQVYKEMEKSVKLFSDDDDDNYGSQMVDYFSDMAVQKVAEDSTKDGSNSLSRILYEQMKRNYGLDKISKEDMEKATELKNAKDSKKSVNESASAVNNTAIEALAPSMVDGE